MIEMNQLTPFFEKIKRQKLLTFFYIRHTGDEI